MHILLLSVLVAFLKFIRCDNQALVGCIGQSSHKIYSKNILNFQESKTILNACTKKSGTLLKVPRIYIYIYIYICIYIYIYIYIIQSKSLHEYWNVRWKLISANIAKFYISQFLTNTMWRNPNSVMVNVFDYDIVVGQFEQQSRCNVYFWTKAFRKKYELLFFPQQWAK